MRDAALNSGGQSMKNDKVAKFLLAVIAIALSAIALRPYIAPHVAHADNVAAYPVYIEPGVQMLKSSDGSEQVYGRMVVDLRTGRIWGFPTMTTDPYPFNALNSKPQTSHPFELGSFAFEDMDKAQ
jgi:hypothetical protein